MSVRISAVARTTWKKKKKTKKNKVEMRVADNVEADEKTLQNKRQQKE